MQHVFRDAPERAAAARPPRGKLGEARAVCAAARLGGGKTDPPRRSAARARDGVVEGGDEGGDEVDGL